MNIDGFLVTVDIEKAFDFVNYYFLILVLKTLDFRKVFLKWIQLLLTNQESCIINGGITRGILRWKKGKVRRANISKPLYSCIRNRFYND